MVPFGMEQEEVDKLCAPPNTYGLFERANKDGTVEIRAHVDELLNSSPTAAELVRNLSA